MGRRGTAVAGHADQLAAENERLKGERDELGWTAAERVLRQQRDEAKAEVERLTGERDAMLETHLAALAQIERCDKAQAALRMARQKMQSMLDHGEWYAPEEAIAQIDAVLKENK